MQCIRGMPAPSMARTGRGTILRVLSVFLVFLVLRTGAAAAEAGWHAALSAMRAAQAADHALANFSLPTPCDPWQLELAGSSACVWTRLDACAGLLVVCIAVGLLMPSTRWWRAAWTAAQGWQICSHLSLHQRVPRPSAQCLACAGLWGVAYALVLAYCCSVPAVAFHQAGHPWSVSAYTQWQALPRPAVYFPTLSRAALRARRGKRAPAPWMRAASEPGAGCFMALSVLQSAPEVAHALSHACDDLLDTALWDPFADEVAVPTSGGHRWRERVQSAASALGVVLHTVVHDPASWLIMHLRAPGGRDQPSTPTAQWHTPCGGPPAQRDRPPLCVQLSPTACLRTSLVMEAVLPTALAQRLNPVSLQEQLRNAIQPAWGVPWLEVTFRHAGTIGAGRMSRLEFMVDSSLVSQPVLDTWFAAMHAGTGIIPLLCPRSGVALLARLPSSQLLLLQQHGSSSLHIDHLPDWDLVLAALPGLTLHWWGTLAADSCTVTSRRTGHGGVLQDLLISRTPLRLRPGTLIFLCKPPPSLLAGVWSWELHGHGVCTYTVRHVHLPQPAPVRCRAASPASPAAPQHAVTAATAIEGAAAVATAHVATVAASAPSAAAAPSLPPAAPDAVTAVIDQLDCEYCGTGSIDDPCHPHPGCTSDPRHAFHAACYDSMVVHMAGDDNDGCPACPARDCPLCIRRLLPGQPVFVPPSPPCHGGPLHSLHSRCWDRQRAAGDVRCCLCRAVVVQPRQPVDVVVLDSDSDEVPPGAPQLHMGTPCPPTVAAAPGSSPALLSLEGRAQRHTAPAPTSDLAPQATSHEPRAFAPLPPPLPPPPPPPSLAPAPPPAPRLPFMFAQPAPANLRPDYCDTQRAQNCGCHALNNAFGYEVTTPSDLQAFRAWLRPDMPLLHYTHGQPQRDTVHAADCEHDSRGSFTASTLSAFLTHHFGVALDAAFLAFREDGQRLLLPLLNEVAGADYMSLLCASTSHFFAIRRTPAGVWLVVDSVAPHVREVTPSMRIGDVSLGAVVEFYRFVMCSEQQLSAVVHSSQQFLPLPSGFARGPRAASGRTPLQVSPTATSPPAPMPQVPTVAAARFSAPPHHPPPPPPATSVSPPRPAPRQSQQRSPYHVRPLLPRHASLPPVGSWMATEWMEQRRRGRNSTVWGLVLAHVVDDGGQQQARVVFCDGAWGDSSVADMLEFAARPVPFSTVPLPARRRVARILSAMRDLTYEDPDFAAQGSNTAEHTALLQDLANNIRSWNPTDWNRAGLDFHPALLRPPPARAAPVSELPHCVMSPRLPSALPMVSPASTTALVPPVAVAPVPLVNTDNPCGGEIDMCDATPPFVSPSLHHPCGFRASPRSGLRSVPQGLRLATHNVSGLTSAAAVHELVHAWVSAGLHVVCLQETWAGRPSNSGLCVPRSQMELWVTQTLHSMPHAPRCDMYWADNTAPLGNAGVATFVFSGPSGSPITVADHRAAPCGRLQTMQLQWAGHSFLLANSYWPATSGPDRVAFLTTTLLPAVRGTALPLCLVGDFNFTTDPAADRRPAPAPATAATDQRLTALFQQHLPQLCDVFRLLHPRGRPKYTYLSGTTVARLDRVYMPRDLAIHTHSTVVTPTPRGTHHCLTIALLPVVPLQPKGPGRRPIPSALVSAADAHDALAAYATRAVAHGLTLPHDALLDWWPLVQARYVSLARTLAGQEALLRTWARAALQEAEDAVLMTMGAVEEAAPPLLPDAIRLAVRAHARARVAAAAAAAPSARRMRHAWVANNERPAPIVTALVHQHQPPPPIPRVATATGAVATTNPAIALAMAQHFASISRRGVVDAVAQQEVLAALRAAVLRGLGPAADGRVRPIPAALAATAGDPVVTTEEVVAALKSAASQSSAGPDGVPYTLWRVGNDCWAPLLARLFTAMGTLRRLPPGFNLGTITPLPKPTASDPSSPAAYRPITLLNTLYRVLGKVLAARFGRALTVAIGAEQSGFLPGRRIEDAINTAELLASALADQGACGAVAFLDIVKAFDTVDREFLYSAMECMGASPGMVAWARLLLQDTAASAHVNGVESPALLFEAGVRQGCPLSPLLYLFVAQALASWLGHQPALGVNVEGRTYVSSHLADDTQVFLSNLLPTTAATLTAALARFSAASGQAVNVAKSAALLVGIDLPPDPPTHLAGIPVVTGHVCLGVPRTNPPAPLPRAPGPYSLRSLQQPMPAVRPPEVPAAIEAWRLRIQRALQRLNRVAALPLSVMGLGQASSAYCLSTFTYHAEFTGLPPAAAAFAAAAAHRIGRGIPANLLHGSPVVGGFGLLPLVAHTTARHAAMASRLLVSLCTPPNLPTHLHSPTPPWMHLAASMLHGTCADLHPAHTLLAAVFADPAHVAQGLLDLPVRQFRALPHGPLIRMATALRALGPPNAPEGQDARTIITTPQRSPARPRPALAHLSWPAAGRHGAPACPAAVPVPVNHFTELLTAGTSQARQRLHQDFVRAALGQRPSAQDMAAFAASLARAWRLPCDSSIKEPLWRAAVNCVPGARIPPPRWRCPCSPGTPATTGNQHTLWDCQVAQAVRQQLSTALPQPVPVTQAAVWLLRTPAPTVQQPVWAVASLAALEAMDFGRRFMWARTRATAAAATDSGQRADPASTVAAAANTAAARFWLHLADFVYANPSGPTAWQLLAGAMGQGHPFLHFHDGNLCVSRPGGDAAEGEWQGWEGTQGRGGSHGYGVSVQALPGRGEVGWGVLGSH